MQKENLFWFRISQFINIIGKYQHKFRGLYAEIHPLSDAYSKHPSEKATFILNPSGIGIIILILGFTLLVIGVKITIPWRVKLYLVWLKTRQGRAFPFCSLPMVGFTLILKISPR